jgi:hypothetical protein
MNVEFLNVKPGGTQNNQAVYTDKDTSPKMSRVQRTVIDDVPGTYAEGNQFERRSGHMTNIPEIFSGFRLSFQPGEYVKLGHHLFSPHSSEFVSHQSLYHPTELYATCAPDSSVEPATINTSKTIQLRSQA